MTNLKPGCFCDRLRSRLASQPYLRSESRRTFSMYTSANRRFLIRRLGVACTRLHTPCSHQRSRRRHTPSCRSYVKQRALFNVHAFFAPVDAVFSNAQALVATGISAVGMATLAEKSSKITAIPGNTANVLADILLSFGASSASVEEYRGSNQAEQEIFQNDQGQCWDSCTVSALFPAEHDVNDTMRVAQDILQLGQLQYKIEEVADQEWVTAIKDSYQPTKVCEGLWIVPDWCDPPEPSSLNICMAPGLAFGTGEHSTTRLCLQRLYANKAKLHGKHVMDYGTGSGILAIAALLMSASSAVLSFRVQGVACILATKDTLRMAPYDCSELVGTDVDALAIKAALDNAKLNGVDSNFTALQCSASVQDPEPLQAAANTTEQPKFDVCIANILRGPLLDLQPRLCSYLKPGGALLLSGILTSQVAAVQEAYKSEVTHWEMTEEQSWALLTGTKR